MSTKVGLLLIAALLGSPLVAEQAKTPSMMRVIHTASNDSLNMRDAPSMKGKVIAKIPYNARDVEYLGGRADKFGTIITKDFVDDAKHRMKDVAWLQIRHGQHAGWAFGKYLFPNVDLPKIAGQDKQSGLIYGVGYRFDSDKAKVSAYDFDWVLTLNEDGSGSLAEPEATISIKWRAASNKLAGESVEIFEHTKSTGPDGDLTPGYPKQVSDRFYIAKQGSELVEKGKPPLPDRVYDIEPFEPQ